MCGRVRIDRRGNSVCSCGTITVRLSDTLGDLVACLATTLPRGYSGGVVARRWTRKIRTLEAQFRDRHS